MRRRYSDDDRATALAALAANGGNVQRTARELSIPEKTLSNWAHGLCHPDVAELGDEKRGPMADALERVAWKLLDSFEDKIAGAKLSETATAYGIAVDKMRLLRGEPTKINEHRDLTAAIESDPELCRAAQELSERLAFGPMVAGRICEGGQSQPLATSPAPPAVESPPGERGVG